MEKNIPQKSLAQIFNESSIEAREAFRGKLDNLFVLVTSSETPVYISPEIADHLSKNAKAVKDALQAATTFLQNGNWLGFAQRKYHLSSDVDYEIPLKKIALNSHPIRKYSPEYTQEMDLVATFDHEIGHLVVKNGFSSNRNLAECAAESYAALRHIQRFGKDTGFFEHNNRAKDIVLGLSPIHYTNIAIQKVKLISEEMDVSRLSLSATAELAAKIADEYALSEETLHRFVKTFHPVSIACLARFGSVKEIKEKLCLEDSDAVDLSCRETLSVIKEHKDNHDIYRIGAQFLNHPCRKTRLKTLAARDPFWRDALDWMAQHEKESGIILDPVKAIDASRKPSLQKHPTPAADR